jgi:site-specific DNA-methyltransferase (adenine-specific)/adenine-specific DNA-methyltransferase
MSLSPEQRQELIRLLEASEEISPEWARVLFPPEKREYELVYHGKDREEDIIVDTLAVPLQPVRTFGRNGEDWHNMLLFGDNLQVLKNLLELKKQGKLYNADGTPGVRLVYIDPPFGTGEEYGSLDGEKAYSAKLKGSYFIEFLRKRLVFLRELLSDDGSMFVRLDYHFRHYFKVVMDEILLFRNEIVINRVQKRLRNLKRFNVGTESLFLYSKDENFFFRTPDMPRRCNFCGLEKEAIWEDLTSPGLRNPPERVIFGKTLLPRRGRHFSYIQEKINGMEKKGHLRLNPEIPYYDLNGKTIDARPEYLQTEDVPVDDNWTDIKGYAFMTGYPTENHEDLLARVIQTGSREGDIVLDAFAGSGTTLAVAEKLKRRWIGIDCGKLAIYTIQKRMLNLRREVGNKGPKLEPKPFTLYNAGLYDFSKLRELPWQDWRFFALELFQCRDERHKIGGIEFDGYRQGASVMVFNHMEAKHKDARITEDTIQEVHEAVGSRVGSKVFIIAPALAFDFQQDYIDFDKVRYYALRIPYSIIHELHRREFTALKQPSDEMAVNDTVEAVGFDFIRTPELKYRAGTEKAKGELFEYGFIKIETFKSDAVVREPFKKKGNLETLSMVMLDFGYDEGAKVFDLDEVHYASDIEKNGWKVRFLKDRIGKKMMAVFLDIYGNEARVLIDAAEFGKEMANDAPKKNRKKK